MLPGTAVEGPSTNVELHISCQNLVNMDVLSLSDPQVFVYSRRSTTAGMTEWSEIGRTEMIKDNLNPNFMKSLRLRYTFESTQYLRFVVFDIDDVRGGAAQQDFIGEAETTLASILSSPNGRFSVNLSNPKLTRVPGQITVIGEEVKENNSEIFFSLSGVNLDKKDLFGKSDPYIIINQRVDQRLVPVYKTEIIMKTLNPVWKPFSMTAQQICNGEIDRPLVFQCYDWNKHGAHDFIGMFETTFRELSAPGDLQFELKDPKKMKKRNYKNSGVIMMKDHHVEQVPSFLDYIRGGCEINMVVGIDFTASNGDPRNPASLHASSPQRPSPYEVAIRSVGSILAYYDRDQMFPVYGYGAKMPDGSTSHCFACNGNPSNPEVAGVDGIISAYHQALSTVTLYGPTYFAPIIDQTCEIIRMNTQNPQEQKYFILLIITDGAINDMTQTVQSIVKGANNFPLSIVIVGVGNSPEFKNMETLDGDDVRLTDRNGIVAQRDIVQFVPFNQCAGDPDKLSQETLAEIPQQLVSYMRQHKITPNPVPAAAAPAAASAAAPAATVASAPQGLPPQ